MRRRKWIVGLGLAGALGAAAFVRAAEPTATPGASEEQLTRLAQRLAGESRPANADADADAMLEAMMPDPAATPRVQSPTEPKTPAAATPASSEARPLGPMSGPPKLLPRQGETPGGGGDGWILSTLAALGVVIGLIFVIRAVYARLGGTVATGSSPVVEVLSRTSVAPKNHVLLLRVGERVLVVSDSTGGMRTLAQIDDAEEVAALLGAVAAAQPASITGSFNQMLTRMHEPYDAVEIGEHGGDGAEHRSDRAEDALSGLLSRIRRVSQRGGVA